MEIAERKVSDVTILDLTGKMTLGEGDEMLKQTINNLLAAGQQKARAEPRAACRTSIRPVSAKSSARTRP